MSQQKNEGRISLMRKTQIADERLLAMFETSNVGQRTIQVEASPESDSSEDETGAVIPNAVSGLKKRRFNSVATQCLMNAAHMELCEMLLNSQETGVMTAQHAKERKIMNRWAEGSLLDVRLEEKFNRDRIMVDRKELLESFRMLLLALAPVESRSRSTAAKKANPAALLPRQLLTPQTSPTRIPTTSALLGNLSIGSDPDGSLAQSPGMVATSSSSSVEHLQSRILQLERQLAMRMRLDWLVPPESTSRTASIRLPSGPPDMATLIQTVVELEGTERQRLAEEEAILYESLSLKWNAVVVDYRSFVSRRQLIVTPYNAYRPQVPLAHSFHGEEFLRRWLLAETFKHYEDVCTQCQQWENDIRCEIEEAAFSGSQYLWEAAFFPYYLRRCGELGSEIVSLHKHKVRYERDAATLALQSNLDIISSEEVFAREQILCFEKDAWIRIGAVSSMLSVLKEAERRATTLKRELTRQGRRYQEEIAGLQTTLAEQMDSRPKSVARVEDYKDDIVSRGGGAQTHKLPPATLQQRAPRPPPASAPKGGSYVEQVYGKRRAPRQLAALSSTGPGTKNSPRKPANDYWAGF